MFNLIKTSLFINCYINEIRPFQIYGISVTSSTLLYYVFIRRPVLLIASIALMIPIMCTREVRTFFLLQGGTYLNNNNNNNYNNNRTYVITS